MPRIQTGLAVSISILALAGSSACATKKFVQTNVGQVDDKVDSLASSLEQTQARVQQTEARVQKNDAQITDVGKEAQAALTAAQHAGEAASGAAALAKTVATEIRTIEKAGTKLIYDVVLSEEAGGFTFNSAELPEAAKTQLDELVTKMKGDSRNVFITIEGHTDDTGAAAVNDNVGLERAKAVEHYLYETHQIPLQKMEVISYGEEKPVAPNTTREGRAKNRRVEIKVMA
jgi:outer membrane protein OmpA-like peptidoglycan-associated protein